MPTTNQLADILDIAPEEIRKEIKRFLTLSDKGANTPAEVETTLLASLAVALGLRKIAN